MLLSSKSLLFWQTFFAEVRIQESGDRMGERLFLHEVSKLLEGYSQSILNSDS